MKRVSLQTERAFMLAYALGSLENPSVTMITMTKWDLHTLRQTVGYIL